jgi:suppressor for copper-sensitivity B
MVGARRRICLRFVTGIVVIAALTVAINHLAHAQPAGKSQVTASAEFSPPDRQGKSILSVTAKIAEGWHIYSNTQKPGGPKKTQIKLEESKSFERVSDFKATKKPEVHEYPNAWPGLKVEEHHGSVIWQAEIELATDVDPAALEIKGAVNAQVCKEVCLAPKDYKFTATLAKGKKVERRDDKSAASDETEPTKVATAEPDVSPEEEQFAGAIPPLMRIGDAVGPTDRDSASRTVALPSTGNAFDLNLVRPRTEEGASYSTAAYLGLAFLGGLILNLMPCVLPVVGLKILSFVEQGHHDRLHVFRLNLWYTLGLMSVFIALATLPVVYQVAFDQTYSWGQQFGDPRFTIPLAAIVFAMALAMLGIWEIPIPGFVGGQKAHELSSKEGIAGAFSKGVVTTLLATPCTAPLMGTALGWAVRQPPYLIYAVFASMGFGMASPYLIIGAFPRLIRFLPKPGAWMETFKHLMGFVLLGTVVWILTFISWSLVVPTIAFLVAIWAACWWIGRTPLTAEPRQRWMAWGWAVAFSGLMGIVSFDWLADVMHERYRRSVDSQFLQIALGGGETRTRSPDDLDWKAFSTEELIRLTADQKTVLVDFTADWCLTCKTLEEFVLNTRDVKSIVDELGIATLVADYTETPTELQAVINALGGNGVPVVAVFPAGDPNRPFVFIGGYTKQQLLDALREAGPSKKTEQVAIRPAT